MSNSRCGDDDDDDKLKHEILLAKRMFFAGCIGLPWLWICNILYFRRKVFGSCAIIDYWPGKQSSSANTVIEEDDDDAHDDDEGVRLERQLLQQELQTWVKRSARGSSIIIPLFVAWIVTFQINKDSFGTNWFVMDPSEAEISGW